MSDVKKHYENEMKLEKNNTEPKNIKSWTIYFTEK